MATSRVATRRPVSVKSTIVAATVFGLLCGIAAVAVSAVWWQLGPNSVNCYWASYDPDPDPDPDAIYGEMAAKMWPTRWFWFGLVAAPTLAGALAGVLATRFGIRVSRTTQ